MRIILISFFVLCCLKNMYATEVRHSCSERNSLTNVATIGDSRAEQLGAQWTKIPGGESFINYATMNSQKIISPGQMLIQNLGQVGGTATDWKERINACAIDGVKFKVPSKVVIHLGGNDLSVYLIEKYKKMHPSTVEKLKQVFGVDKLGNVIKATTKLLSSFRKVSLKGFLKGPFKVLSGLMNSMKDYIKTLAKNFTGNPTALHSPDFTSQYEWQDQVEIDRITTDMRNTIIPHLLNQSDNHRAILNVVQPTAPNAGAVAYIVAGVKDLKFFYSNAQRLFNGLRTSYRANLYLPLEKKYGNRIILLDTYYAYWHSILHQNSNYYIQDGIHFSAPSGDDVDRNRTTGNTGLEYWGKMIAISMVKNKWFTSTLPASTFASQFLDSEIELYAYTINQKANSHGIDSELIELMPVDPSDFGASKYFPQDPIIITYMEFDYEFDNDKAFYVRNGDIRAYMVRGDIRSMYEGNGGPDGKLGFPIQDEVTGSIFESFRTQNFECGSIMKNYFDLITPQKIIMNETTPECLAKKARDAN